MTPRAAIFDLDGTLLDTLQDLADSMNEALRKNGFPAHPADSYRLFVGEGVDQLAIKALGAGENDSGLVKRLVADMRSIYSEKWHSVTRPYPGIPEALAGLSSADIPLAVLSNKPDSFTKLMTRHFFPDIPFRMILGARDNLPKKPDPAGALEIARVIGVRPADTVLIGDSGTDMRTAVAAGMVPAGVLWGFRSRKELTEGGARVLLNKPGEIPGLFSDRPDQIRPAGQSSS